MYYVCQRSVKIYGKNSSIEQQKISDNEGYDVSGPS